MNNSLMLVLAFLLGQSCEFKEKNVIDTHSSVKWLYEVSLHHVKSMGSKRLRSKYSM